jgi:exodeoxyribonuclease V beta subunit
MRKFDVLARDLNVYGTHFLEASAGTGKTFAIEHLVTRLLFEGKAPLTIDQILVVTFTRASTRELKLRIRKNLIRTQQALKARESEWDYLLALIEKGPDAIDGALTRIAEALISFDQAQIFTVHGFCHRMLSECAFEAKIAFDPPSPEEGEQRGLITAKIRETLRDKLKMPAYSTSQITRVLKRHHWKIGKLVQSLYRTVGRHQEIYPFSSFETLYQRFQEALSRLEAIELHPWLDDFLALKVCYYDMKPHIHEENALLLGKILAHKSCTHEEFDHLLSQEELFLEKMVPEKLMKKAKLPDFSQLHYPELLLKLQSTLLPLLKEGSHPGKIFLGLARDCQEVCQEVSQQQEQFSPDDLLKRMQAALAFPEFVEKVRSRIRAAIIDEFQDTDPVQWEIFQKLFLNEQMQAVCLVGDPKQSIYAFRNADVYTYLAAASQLGEQSHAYLDTNFRSSATLVDALNRLFCAHEGKGWMRLPAQGSTLSVPPVKAFHPPEESSVSNRGSVHFFLATGIATHLTKKWPTEQMQEEAFFPFIAQEIWTLKQTENKDWDKFAVLVKDRYQARQLYAFLKQYNIPACIKRGGSLTDTVAYSALLELLEAAISPQDLSALKRLLAGPLLGKDVDAVQQDTDNETLWRFKAQLLELSEILSQRGFACFFQEFIHRLRVNREILSRGDLSLYSDLRQLVEILIEHEIAHKCSKDSLFLFLEGLKELDPEEESWLKIRVSEEKGSVLLMTTHLSKGLEFDTVFALGLASRGGPKEEIVVKEEGRAQISVYDPQHLGCQRAIEESDAEKLRQFYVALTRAKTRVYVPFALNQGNKESLKLGHASACELFFAHLRGADDLYHEIKQLDLPSLTECLEVLGNEASITYSLADTATVTCPELPFTGSSALVPPLPLNLQFKQEVSRSFSALAEKRGGSTLLRAPELSLFPTAHSLPLGAETGLLFHRIIEKILRAGWHSPLQTGRIQALILEETKGTSFEAWQEVLSERALSALQIPLVPAPHAFCLSDIPSHHMLQEAEFAYPIPEGMMKGFADLFFEYEGKYYLLDWKTNYLGATDTDYRQENLIQAMQNNDYFLQASLYAEALRRYVKLFDMRPFESCFGGAIYVFVRANAVHYFMPRPV